MKIRITRSTNGMTLLELMIVLAVLGVLALLLLPALAKTKHRPYLSCPNNLKQLGVAFKLWSLDLGGASSLSHDLKFPMQISTNEGGTRELVEYAGVVPHLRLLSNELNSPKTLWCATEQKRTYATNFDSDLTPNHISYFVGIDVTETNTMAILAGDRNITKTKPTKNGIVALTTNTPPEWTKELHNGQGYVLFGDGHVEGMDTATLQKRVGMTGFTTNRLAMP